MKLFKKFRDGARRMKFRDVAIAYRMSAGVQGDVTRTHPVTIEPALNDTVAPVTAFGLGVLYKGSTNAVRAIATSDTAITKIDGIAVRPWPIQQVTGGMTAAFGGGTPPVSQPIDILKAGYVMVPCFGTPQKGGAVFVRVAASSGSHILGGFEAAADSTNTIALATDGRIYWNGPPDANGLAELAFNV